VSIFIHRSVLGMQNTATQIKHSITIKGDGNMYGFGNMNVKPVPHPSLCNPDSYIHITHYTELISTGIL
jgi:hypothetical protein